MKKNNLKKLMSLMLAAGMAVSVTGCGGNKDDEVASNGNMPTLRWIMPGEKPNDYNLVMEEVNKQLAEKIGAQLEVEYVDGGAYKEKMNMYMASGDNFDLAFAGYMLSITENANKGGFLCLDEYLEKNQELKNSIPDYMWDCMKYHGEIYGVPNQQVMPVGWCAVVKKELADKYSLNPDEIHSIEDLEPFFEQIKQNEPDKFPFNSDQKLGSFNTYFEDYDETGNYIACKEDENGKYTAYLKYEQPEWKKAVWKMREYYEKGYIRADVASVMDNTADVKAGKYAVGLSTYKPGLEQEYSSTGSNNYCIPIYNRPVINSCTASTAVGKKSKNPEKAVELLQLVNTDKEFFNLLTLGIENVHYERVGDNAMKFIGDKNTNGYYLNNAWAWGNQFNSYTKEGAPEDVWEQTKKYNDESRPSKLIGFSIDDTNIRTELSQMESIVSEYSAIANGSVDPDTYYDEFLGKLKAAGSEKVVAEYQKQIDEFLANK